jgi:hypothetical protein
MEYKSVQDLIIKAALRDGVSTTIRPYTFGTNAIEVVFTKGVDRTSVAIDLTFHDEHMVLYMLKSTLFNLFEAPYKNIEVTKYECE